MADVFVSWSGERSRNIAESLSRWLPNVLQGLEVWTSEHDITAGARWNIELAEQLDSTYFGILCLTPENLTSPWLIFEAGALSKAIKESRVAPYRFGLQTTDVAPPLSQFQGVDADEKGTLRMIMSIHQAIDSKLEPQQVEKQFEKWWPELAERLARTSGKVPEKVRSEREMLEELLELMRRTGSKELQNSLSRILDLPNVQSISILKWKRAGRESSEILLRIRVFEKKPLSELAEDEVIPNSIYGMTTDVVEVKS